MGLSAKLRDLDRAVEARLPERFRRSMPPAARLRLQLGLCVAFQIWALVCVFAGPPWSYGAAGPLGGSIGTLLGVLYSTDKLVAPESPEAGHT